MQDDGTIELVYTIDTPQNDYCMGIYYDSNATQLVLLIQSSNNDASLFNPLITGL
jgi:hypothetical protein